MFVEEDAYFLNILPAFILHYVKSDSDTVPQTFITPV